MIHWKKRIYKYMDIDIFCQLKDNGLDDKIISYDEYLKMRDIRIIRNKNNKIVVLIKNKNIGLFDIITAKYNSLFVYIIEKYIDGFPLNILIDSNWSEKKINMAFGSKKIYYIFDGGKKTIKINSMKSAINKYNYPAVLDLLYIGIKPTEIDLKVADYVNIKQITDAIKYFY